MVSERPARDRLLRRHRHPAVCGDRPDYHWAQNPPGTALSYLTAPLRTNTVVIGAGAVHVWIEASTPSVDLQVTVSEVRPDGRETFVQSGWLRASERKLDPRRARCSSRC